MTGNDKFCQFHSGTYDHHNHLHGDGGYAICSRPVKFENPEPTSDYYKFVCGIHARAINNRYKAINSKLRCIPIDKDKK
jgi:hypothetical protein